MNWYRSISTLSQWARIFKSLECILWNILSYWTQLCILFSSKTPLQKSSREARDGMFFWNVVIFQNAVFQISLYNKVVELLKYRVHPTTYLQINTTYMMHMIMMLASLWSSARVIDLFMIFEVRMDYSWFSVTDIFSIRHFLLLEYL